MEVGKDETMKDIDGDIDEDIDSEEEEFDDLEGTLVEEKSKLEIETMIKCKGITEVSYQVMDASKEFIADKHKTKANYKSKNEKKVSR